jgi:hypothetical protein
MRGRGYELGMACKSGMAFARVLLSILPGFFGRRRLYLLLKVGRQIRIEQG